MRTTDLAILVVYLLGVTAFGCSFYFRKGAKGTKGFVSGGGCVPGWASALHLVPGVGLDRNSLCRDRCRVRAFHMVDAAERSFRRNVGVVPSGLHFKTRHRFTGRNRNCAWRRHGCVGRILPEVVPQQSFHRIRHCRAVRFGNISFLCLPEARHPGWIKRDSVWTKPMGMAFFSA